MIFATIFCIIIVVKILTLFSFNFTITRDTFYIEILNHSPTNWLIILKRKYLYDLF